MKKIKRSENETKLQAAVRKMVNYHLDNYRDCENPLESFLNDLRHGGCISGMISGLIYYNDTTAFYKRHKQEINDLLAETCDSTGLTTCDLFGDKFESADPLAMYTPNQNLLAWFAFEETAFNFGRSAGLDI